MPPEDQEQRSDYEVNQVNQLQELQAIHESSRLLSTTMAQAVDLDVVWTKLYHAKQYLNGIASQILSEGDDF